MLRPQQRRHPRPGNATAPAAPPDPTDVDSEDLAPAVPRQTRPRPDAYDLYAQIYALRTSAADDKTWQDEDS